MTNNKKGFTLIELLVVIAIIGILSAIGLVSLNGAREKARDAQSRSDLSTFRAALALYYDDHDNTYPGNVAVGTLDSSDTSGGTGATANSVWASAGPMITEYIQTIKSPSSTVAYQYGASNFTAGATNGAGAYIVSYKLEAAGGANYYSVNNLGTVKDTKDGDTTAPTCVTDASATNHNGTCSG